MSGRSLVVLALTACRAQWLAPDGADLGAVALVGCVSGRACNPIPVSGFPSVFAGDTRTATDDLVDAYACAPSTDEGGREVWYAVEVPSPGRLTASIVEVSGDGIDVDVHVLSSQDPDACLARGHATAAAQVEAGTTYVVVDTFVSSSGAAQAGPYSLTVDFVPLPVSDCATIPTEVAMRWTSCSSSVDDCSGSGAAVTLETPTTGPVVLEAHLVTVEDGISGWPSSSRDRITTHYATSAAVSGYDMARTESWAPAGEGGSEYGQGATSVKIPAEAEAFYINMNWETRPAGGTPMIVRNRATGRAVVAAAGYETGPGANTAVAGVTEEVHDWLGTGHLDDLEIGFAADLSLPFGPVACDDDLASPPEEEPPPSSVIEACYLGELGDGTTCLPVGAVPAGNTDYDYPDPLNDQYAAPIRYLDLAALDPELALAPSFVLSELAQEFKGQYAVVQPHAIAHLQAMRDDLGAIVVNSGYRSPGYNDGISGSATWSRHMYGDAFDIEAVGASLSVMADTCEDEGADYVSIYSGHVHCDWRNEALDAAFYGGARAAPEEAAADLVTAELVDDGQGLTAPAEGFDEGEPLRTWTSFGADGSAIETVNGERYLPPADAVRVEVDVGRRVVLGLQVGS